MNWAASFLVVSTIGVFSSIIWIIWDAWDDNVSMAAKISFLVSVFAFALAIGLLV
jgi:hypothetical protein